MTNQYLYGADGQAVAEMDGSGNWLRTNVRVGGQFLAELQGTKTYYRLNDHLGTVRAEFGSDGCLSTYTSLPFGDGQTTVANGCADITLHHFTGKERDTESGNDYFGARYYASSMGRFMSPDWSDDPDPIPYADTDNPQSLNLYGYVGNNPMNDVDDDGHLDCSGGALQDVACAVTAAAKKVWSFLTSGADNSSVTTSSTFEMRVDQFASGASKEIGNTFESAQNTINSQLGGPQHPLQSIGGAEAGGAFAAGVGMLFVPGPEELQGMKLLSREGLLGEINNPALRNIISKLYREGAAIGDGSTAAAVEHETATGEAVGGKWHSQKARESINALRKILRSQNLSPREQVIARYILERTEKALGLGPI